MKLWSYRFGYDVLITLLVLTTISSCTTTKVAGACPGSKNLRCLTGQTCSFDENRGCQVCHCDTPNTKTMEPDGTTSEWSPPPGR